MVLENKIAENMQVWIEFYDTEHTPGTGECQGQ